MSVGVSPPRGPNISAMCAVSVRAAAAARELLPMVEYRTLPPASPRYWSRGTAARLVLALLLVSVDTKDGAAES